MLSLLLIIVIYIAFISLGLPDSMLGAAWPAMYQDLHVPVSYAGFISMTICFGTVVSSICYSRLSRRFHTETITILSVAATAAALLGFSFAPTFPCLIALALILGLGAGSVDAGLNNYVALHFKARAMNFLHASWGLGTLVGPFLLSYLFANGLGWRPGYRVLGTAQSCIVLLLIFSIPLWRRNRTDEESSGNGEESAMDAGVAIREKGVAAALIGFFSYCAMENTAMLWSATFLVSARGFSESQAAGSAGLLFWGMTAGRIVAGLISDKLGDSRMIRIGEILIAAAAALLIALPPDFCRAALFLLGLGFGPIYPAMIHQTPECFGAKASGAIIGLEMASAYVGSAFMPPLFGALGRATTMGILPFFVLFFTALNFMAIETKKRKCLR